ncbi:MAG: hypothetical protein V1766_04790 [Pseudomonadota bacterium]
MSMKVGKILIKQGVIEEQSVRDALSIQGLTKKNIGEILVDAGTLTTQQKQLLKKAFLAVSRLQQTTQHVINL